MAKRLVEIMKPIIFNQKALRIFSELEKPSKFYKIESTNKSISNDFEYRSVQQKLLNEKDLKRSKLELEHRERVKRFNSMLGFLIFRPFKSKISVDNSFKGTGNLPRKKTASVLKQEKIVSALDKFRRSRVSSPLFFAMSPNPSEFNVNGQTIQIIYRIKEILP